MKQGKCWIYKRAVEGDEQLDYTDGTHPFDCTVHESNGKLVNEWKFTSSDGKQVEIDIPVNIPHTTTDSITNQGAIGNIQYEFLYGKFRTYPQYYWKLLKYVCPFILMGVVLCCVVQRLRRRKRK
ncbi:hypothetical protein OAV62_01345 [bacterium]|nr:hypothetical protein [bacterium]